MGELDSFGEWLRQRRTALDLTRAELAECAGCSVSAVRKIESDERRPSRQLAELLAHCLSITPDKQQIFVDAARGVRRVARLGAPAPRAVLHSSLTLSGFSNASPSMLSTPRDWNLPSVPTPLIGREAELATLAELLSDPHCRLLTLVGPGGIGKTRLAIEVACLQWHRFADGVYFASLAATSSPEFLEPTVAQAIGLNFAGPADPRSQLTHYLCNKQIFLLLDNLEHLLEGLDLVTEILEKAPGVKLLATSRERLHLQGEWVFEVQGLPVPANEDIEGVESYSSVELFLHRARRAQVNFALTAKNRRHVVRICQLVEGMPLAIELAAAWVPVLSCREIVQELERGQDILVTTLRDVPTRQRSLRAVFDHSWHLLDAEEQRVMRRLSVFRGGFQREAAQYIADASLASLSALVAQSFLRRTATRRFTMHTLVRQYAGSKLTEDPEEEAAVRERHSAYFVNTVARLEAELKGAGQLDALAEMDAEIDNIRSAWRCAVRHGTLASIRQPMRALWYFYDIRGWFQEAEANFCWAAERLEETLITRQETETDVAVLCAYARTQQGWFCLRIGRFEEAQRLLESNLGILRAAGAYAELVDALQHAGALDRLMGRYAQSRARFQEMLEYAVQACDPWNAAIAEGNIGLAAQALGDYQEARERMSATVVSFRALGDRRMLAVALHYLGGTSCILGRYDEAHTYLSESLTLSRSIGDRWVEGMTLRELANVAQAKGADADAISLYRQSLVLAREIGEHWSILQAMNGLGAAMLALGDVAGGGAAFREGLVMAWEMQALPDVLVALGGLVRCLAQQGIEHTALPAALKSTVVILSHPAASQKTKTDAFQLRSELESRLTTAQLEAAQANSENLSLESTVASILQIADVNRYVSEFITKPLPGLDDSPPS